ncbi:MAG: carboxylating nicotinate-nucleotide diphosphorylase [Myxococcota bacterium]
MALDELSKRLIAMALEEDVGPGDVTAALLPSDLTGQATVVAREPLVLAGQHAFVEVFRQVDPAATVVFTHSDGAAVPAGTSVATVAGKAQSLLVAERTALNLLQRLSGVATMARKAVEQVQDTSAAVVDTRKTTPGWRRLEKAAVRAGGARNHRMGLFDGILIKDNHIEALGSVDEAVERARNINGHLLKIEVECESLEMVQQALDAGADIVLLDNMDLPTTRKAVALVAGRAQIEASGGITLKTLRDVAETGVDLISMGALTHSARAMDLALDWST